jgi:hypothetical protein
MLGIGTKTREDNGDLTRNGKIALIGIVTAGLLAIGTSIYEFATGQQKAREDHLKTERLMNSIQAGLFPIRNASAAIAIDLSDSLPGVIAYRSKLRRYIPVLTNCIETPYTEYCQNTDEGWMYAIPAKSALFLPRKLHKFLEHDFLKLAVAVPSGHKEHPYTLLGHSMLPFENLHFENVHVTFTPASGRIQYVVGKFALPNESLTALSAYSLVDIFPGFAMAVIVPDAPGICRQNMEAFDLKEAKKHSDDQDPDNDDDVKVYQDCMTQLAKGMSLTGLFIGFEYPKSLLFDESSTFKCSSQNRPEMLVLPLPDTVYLLNREGHASTAPVPPIVQNAICSLFDDLDDHDN